jgi:hypothetical protein
MSRRAISMSSYDRLFPNQDTMPAGGLGNLIALPLQHARRRDGCTVFLGPDLEPIADQWAYLAGIERLPAARGREIAVEAEQLGGALGLRSLQDTGTRVPSRRLTMTERQIEVTLGGRIQLSASSVPPALRDRLCRTAAFANPTFYERERARLSTHKTPRVIACHEQTGESLLLPRGCGRLHRHHDAKHEIRIIDYVDRSVPVLRRMFAKRQRAYTGLGYGPG